VLELTVRHNALFGAFMLISGVLISCTVFAQEDEMSKAEAALMEQESEVVTLEELTRLLDSEPSVLSSVMSEMSTFGREDACNPRIIYVGSLPASSEYLTGVTGLSITINCNGPTEGESSSTLLFLRNRKNELVLTKTYYAG
jgi:hypothetical protein